MASAVLAQELIVTCTCSFAYNRDTDEYLAGTTTGVEVWKLSLVKRKRNHENNIKIPHNSAAPYVYVIIIIIIIVVVVVAVVVVIVC